nr:PREDICTED: tetratricopeptide repeat protein 25 isoform X1 [Lepisosteus oculatus]
MSDQDEGEQGPKSSFTTYIAEGDQLYQKGEHVKAIESYTTALSLQPDDRNCLVARSRCYLKMGDPEKALKDAESSLKEDNEFFKGLYQKAEALYAMGDFEFALVFYHRGHKLRPELQEFRLGIQKAQEAIDNSVGSPSSVKLENKGDLSFFHKKDEVKKGKPKEAVRPLKREQKQQSKKESPKTEKTARQLLGELYSDKEYLEKLLKDEDLIKGNLRSGMKVQDLILGGIAYLDTRTEFWRQQKPIYARERDRKLMQQKWNKTRQNKPCDPTGYILRSLEEIDMALAAGNAEGSCKKTRQVLHTVQAWSDEHVPNKREVMGNLYSCMGNALIEMGDMDGALDNHKRDLDIAKENNLPEAKSRALDNIGRVYARIGKFPQAIEAWEEKIPLAKTSLEKTWLFHEIGRCHLELGHHAVARDYGDRSLAAALETGDSEWQLNASVLVAQSDVKLGNFPSAVTSFQKALEIAKLLKDDAAQQAVQKALNDAAKHTTGEPKADQSTAEKMADDDGVNVREQMKEKMEVNED